MGNLFIKLGKAIIKFNWHLKCKYNQVILKLVLDVSECPVDKCVCKK
jgi:hypothetical protein